jgi:hypothetical protein
MEDAKNDKQTGQESLSEVHPRHKQAREFTRELIEEQLSSSSDTSDSPGRAG